MQAAPHPLDKFTPLAKLPSRVETFGAAVDACLGYARKHYARAATNLNLVDEVYEQTAFSGGIERNGHKSFRAALSASGKGKWLQITIWRLDDGRYEPNCYAA